MLSAYTTFLRLSAQSFISTFYLNHGPLDFNFTEQTAARIERELPILSEVSIHQPKVSFSVRAR